MEINTQLHKPECFPYQGQHAPPSAVLSRRARSPSLLPPPQEPSTASLPSNTDGHFSPTPTGSAFRLHIGTLLPHSFLCFLTFSTRFAQRWPSHFLTPLVSDSHRPLLQCRAHNLSPALPPTAAVTAAARQLSAPTAPHPAAPLLHRQHSLPAASAPGASRLHPTTSTDHEEHTEALM